ncbi:hypothetical protein [Haloferula sp. BvORR071]|uniref:hypothetical protein n=1 Tax=Haloferula sp. BvORR071 TaxID=1396141 RepID=UPI00055605C2|nr:hypothetical protein [Haloferula sp. BvORR071]
MKPRTLVSLLAALAATPVPANTLLFADNFNVANSTNFDGTSSAGRLTGSLASSVVLRSARVQQQIQDNQLRLILPASGGGGRVRFQNPSLWFDWAAGATGTSILADGGLRVEFDFVATDITSANWVSFNMGHSNQAAGEPATRVNHAATDYGILFRNNGATERFDNSANKGAGGSTTPVLTARHIVIDYVFSSFADAATVRARSKVDGVQVADDTFNWDGNAGVLYMELETNQVGTLIDNYSVSTIPVEYTLASSKNTVISGSDLGDLVATLSGSTFAKGPEASVFTLVSGTGDVDNGKFQINGDRLEAKNYDFTQDPGGTTYRIRVQGTGSVTGGTIQTELVLTSIKDDDEDGLLDTWEILHANDLTSLNGLASGPGPGPGTGDFDGDGISDLQEQTYGAGLYPGMSPTSKDSDGDGLFDNEELAGAGFRLPTNPVLADTDRDGLNDKAESNKLAFVDANDTGSNPVDPDTDSDGSRDGFEVAHGSDPMDSGSKPALPPAFALVPLTDDESTGISTTKVYSHLISGGNETTLNGLTFLELSPTTTPPNFSWTTSAVAKSEVNPFTNGDWVPDTGNVTGADLTNLFGAFTYCSNGNPGVSQTFTLSGLTVGGQYQLKIFIRPWDTEGSGRPIDLIFTNGSSVEQPFGALREDRPGAVLGNGNEHSAYYLSYNYTAQSSSLVIDAKVHESAAAASGSFHLYGLANEVLSVPASLKITGVTRNAGGDILINFTGAGETQYHVTKSPDLTTPFGPLVPPVNVTTNVAGAGQAIVPASEASERREFYRIEN